MKTIEEKVEGMSMTELQNVARGKYHQMQMDVLLSIANIQICYPDVEGQASCYYRQKMSLECEDLFNPQWEELFQKAVKGKLYLSEVSKEIGGLQ